MDATFRTSANNSYTNGADAGKPDTVKNIIAQHRDSAGNVNVSEIINALKAIKNNAEGESGIVAQMGAELEKIAHPFDMARFDEAFKSELPPQSTLTYHGKPIVVGSGIDRTQQTRQYADDAIFSYRNAKGVVEITNEFAFVDEAKPRLSAVETAADKSAVDSACKNSTQKLASFEFEASWGKGSKGSVSAPSLEVPIHDGKTKDDAKFEIGEKGEIKNATIQLTGYAENTIDSGSVHLNEKGALVTTTGVSGNSGLGLGAIENDSKSASASINAIETEFEAKTEVHVDANTSKFIGTKSSAEVKLNLLEINGEKKYTINLPTKDINLALTGEAQAGPAIKAEVTTGPLVESKPVNVEGSLFRGKATLDIELKNKNCN